MSVDVRSHRSGYSKRSSLNDNERVPGPDEVYTTSIFGGGGAIDQGGSGQAAPLVVGETCAGIYYVSRLLYCIFSTLTALPTRRGALYGTKCFAECHGWTTLHRFRYSPVFTVPDPSLTIMLSLNPPAAHSIDHHLLILHRRCDVLVRHEFIRCSAINDPSRLFCNAMKQFTLRNIDWVSYAVRY